MKISFKDLPLYIFKHFMLHKSLPVIGNSTQNSAAKKITGCNIPGSVQALVKKHLDATVQEES